MPRSRGRKRAVEDSSKPEDAAKRGLGKRVRASRKPNPKPKPEAEYFHEKRNLEDLWLSAFPVGTEKALEEGGKLYGKTVYLFGSTEPQLLIVNGESKIILIPIVVAVTIASAVDMFKIDCPFPPSDKIGINSVQRENEEIVSMKAMKMAWVPYVPLEDRSALRHLKTERVKLFDYCMPYYMPLNPPEDEDDKVVDILYPLEQPIVCEFNWEVDDYEDFADEKVKEEDLPENEKEKFMEFLKEKVRKRKRELKQAKDARKKAIDDMDAKAKEAFENIQFYKFYPAKTQDTPDVSNVKAKYIHRYYRNAHHLMQFASNVAFSISIAKELSYASWKSWHRNFEQLWEVLQGVGVRLFGEEGCGG